MAEDTGARDAFSLLASLGLGSHGGQGRDEAAARVTAAVEAAVTTNGVFVGISSEGPSDLGLVVILYLSAGVDAAEAVDRAFAAAWRAAPFLPGSIAVGAAVGVLPERPDAWEPDSLDPGPIAERLGIDPSVVAQTWIDLQRPALLQRYGTPAGGER